MEIKINQIWKRSFNTGNKIEEILFKINGYLPQAKILEYVSLDGKYCMICPLDEFLDKFTYEEEQEKYQPYWLNKPHFVSSKNYGWDLKD